MADWASLPADLAACIADRVRGADDDLDHYMDFRAVCHAWRSATDDPRASPRDPRFLPRRWAALDEAHQSNARLFVNLDTGRFIRKDLPMLRHYFLVAGAAGGLLVLAERSPPHAVRVLNPFTGAMIRFKAPVPHETGFVAHVIGPAPTLVLLVTQFRTIYCADPDDERFRYPGDSDSHFSHPILWMAVVGSIYSYSAARENNGSSSFSSLFRAATYNFLDLMGQLFDDHFPDEELQAQPGGFVVEESQGEILVVFEVHHRMKVFKINTVANVVEPVKDLGTRSLFLGYSRCLSVDASKLPSVDANCIYRIIFRDLSTLDFGVCVYSLRDETHVTYCLGSPPLTVGELLSSHNFNVRAGLSAWPGARMARSSADLDESRRS